MASEFIASTIPARVLRGVSGTTLFQIAMQQTGDPLQWVAIAELNGLTDPWLSTPQDILIPPVFPTGTQTGILSGVAAPAITVTLPVILPSTPVAAPTGQFLDFSQPQDSQYLPLI